MTHSHPEGIKEAQATALAVFMAREGASKEAIRDEMAARFDCGMDHSLGDIRPDYRFDVSCQGSFPESIIAFVESDGVEDAIRKAVSLEGDSDTMACIAGGIAEAYYGGIPESIVREVRSRLPERFLKTIDTFYRQ